MSKVIIRVEKIKTAGNLISSLKHNLRVIKPMHQCKASEKKNEYFVSSEVEQAYSLAKIRWVHAASQMKSGRLRKNAVLAVEYMISASPEWFKSQESDKEFFEQAIEWLENRHGRENIINISIHRDETTPHLHAHIVPIDDKGKLNCREFLGGKAKMVAMQSDFAQHMKELGLERGLKGSKATHSTLKSYYAKANQNNRGDIKERIKPLSDVKLDTTNPVMLTKTAQEKLDHANARIQHLSALTHKFKSANTVILDKLTALENRVQDYSKIDKSPDDLRKALALANEYQNQKKHIQMTARREKYQHFLIMRAIEHYSEHFRRPNIKYAETIASSTVYTDRIVILGSKSRRFKANKKALFIRNNKSNDLTAIAKVIAELIIMLLGFRLLRGIKYVTGTRKIIRSGIRSRCADESWSCTGNHYIRRNMDSSSAAVKVRNAQPFSNPYRP